MQRVFRFCSNRGIINLNPIESLRRSDGAHCAVKDRRLSDEEIKTVWNALPEMRERQQLIAKFLILTGCRSTEIRTAKWEWSILWTKHGPFQQVIIKQVNRSESVAGCCCKDDEIS